MNLHVNHTFNKLHKFHFCGSLNSYNPTQNLLRQIMKMPIFSYHPGKNWNLRQMNAPFSPSPYPKLFMNSMAIIHVGFYTKTTLDRGWGGGLLLFRRDGSRAKKFENRWNCLNSFVWGCRLQSNVHSTYSTEDKLKTLAAEVLGHLLVTCALKWQIDHLH